MAMTAFPVARAASCARPWRALLVDDNEHDTDLLTRMLRRQLAERVQVCSADCGQAALEILEREPIDVVLVDYRLPDMDGLDLLAQIAARELPTAAILLTGQGSEKVAAQAIKQGASDYLLKNDITPDELERVIAQAIAGVKTAVSRQQSLYRLEQAHAEMDHFVRSLSHDMTANFMVLESSFRQLKHSCDSPAQLRLSEGVNHVEACLQQSKRFLQDLTLLAKTGSVELKPAQVDLNEILREIAYELNPLFVERGALLVIQSDLPVVWCNAARVKQVFDNLLRNALKHGCDAISPQIRVTTALAPRPTPGLVWLRVWDNGAGISPEDRETIFLPGHRLPTAHPAGTGMGLAIVRKIIEHYGGTIQVDSANSTGTAMLLGLPTLDVTTADHTACATA